MMDEARLAEAWGWFEGVSLVEAILRLSVAVTVGRDVRRRTSDELEWHAAMAHASSEVIDDGVGVGKRMCSSDATS
jgi:hypothetical protein